MERFVMPFRFRRSTVAAIEHTVGRVGRTRQSNDTAVDSPPPYIDTRGIWPDQEFGPEDNHECNQNALQR